MRAFVIVVFLHFRPSAVSVFRAYLEYAGAAGILRAALQNSAELSNDYSSSGARLRNHPARLAGTE
jgi:hypothetical protein